MYLNHSLRFHRRSAESARERLLWLLLFFIFWEAVIFTFAYLYGLSFHVFFCVYLFIYSFYRLVVCSYFLRILWPESTRVFFCRAVGTGYRFQPTGKLCCSRYACHLILVAGSMNEIFLVVFICFLFVRIPERACRQRMKIFFSRVVYCWFRFIYFMYSLFFVSFIFYVICKFYFYFCRVCFFYRFCLTSCFLFFYLLVYVYTLFFRMCLFMCIVATA